MVTVVAVMAVLCRTRRQRSLRRTRAPPPQGGPPPPPRMPSLTSIACTLPRCRCAPSLLLTGRTPDHTFAEGTCEALSRNLISNSRHCLVGVNWRCALHGCIAGGMHNFLGKRWLSTEFRL